MALLTIITPTYNRANLLSNLYYSLENQQDHDFEWLIVDDGSKDKTEKVIKTIKTNATFPIHYICKSNGGKHTAINFGINLIQTELTMIVDSDDLLLEDAVSNIKAIHEKYKSNKSIGAYSFLRCYSNGKAIVDLDNNEFLDSYVTYRIKRNIKGDMAEVFKTKILNKFHFPEFKGENFLSEDVLWIQIGLRYLFVFINKAIYQCEYINGGLTDQDKIMKFASPLGMMMRGKMLMNKECGIIANIKGAIIYNCYNFQRIIKFKAKDSRLALSFRESVFCFFTLIVFCFFYAKWYIKTKNKK